MAVPPYVEGHDGTGRARVRVDAARLFDVPVLAPTREGALGNANTARLALVAVLAPFMTDAKPATKVATAAINLVIGSPSARWSPGRPGA